MFENLLKATAEGKKTQAELRELQREALDFQWFSNRDSSVEKLEAFGNHVYQRVAQEVELYNPLDLFYDMVPGELDTELEFSEVIGYGRVYDWAYGTVRKASSLTQTAWTVRQSPRAMHFRIPVQKLQTGRLMVSDLVSAAAKGILVHKISLGLNVFNANFPALGAFTTDLNNAAIGQNGLDAAIRRIRGVCDIRAIVGSARALFPLDSLAGYDALGFDDATKAELHRKGVLGMFRGIPVIRIKDFTDERYNVNPISNTDIYIVPVTEKARYNVYSEIGSTRPEPPQTHQEDQTVSLYWQWEDGAAVNAAANRQQYFHRFCNAAIQ